MKTVAIGLVAAALAGPAGAQSRSDISVTLYSTAAAGAVSAAQLRDARRDGSNLPGYAIVHERRELSLAQGVSEVRDQRIPALLDPSTVQFGSDSNSTIRLLGQRLQVERNNIGELLQLAKGEQVEVEQRRGAERVTVRGRLLSADEGLVLQQENGEVQLLRDYDSVRLDGLPEGVVTRPTLVWTLQADRGGEYPVDLRYETGGMTWWTDYNLSFSTAGQGCKADMSAWASIVNRSGRTFEHTHLKLVAGDLNRASDAATGPRLRTAMLEAAPKQGFSEQAFSAYHLYRLDRPVTLMDGAIQQLQLFPNATGISCEQSLVYSGSARAPVGMLRQPILERSYGANTELGVRVHLSFRNSRENALGMPLPAGRIRVSKADADGNLELVGEDNIDHTPDGEIVRVNLGRAFDVVAERSQQDFEIDEQRRVLEEGIEIRLRNRRPQPVEVEVDEHLARWRQWRIIEASHTFDKKDANTVRFPVEVPADGESVLRYRVRYTW